MIVGFVCPDGAKIRQDDCFNSCRYESGRCMPRPILYSMAEGKEIIKGLFSVTQLITPTRISYLRLANDIYIRPRDSIKMYFGTLVHTSVCNRFGASELQLNDHQVSGRIDLIDEGHLIDYKVWGSYRVATALGMGRIKKINPKTNRLNTYWVEGFEKDLEEETMQLNRYRMLAEGALQRVQDMSLFVMVKDAEIQIAIKRNITETSYTIPIPFMDNDAVMNWFETKKQALLHALQDKESRVCNEEERWHGNRCKTCDVQEFCDVGIVIKEIEDESNDS